MWKPRHREVKSLPKVTWPVSGEASVQSLSVGAAREGRPASAWGRGVTHSPPSRENLSTPVIPAATPSPATRPAATATIAGSIHWIPWSQSKTPSPRAAPVTAALTPPCTPPAPAACPWARHLGRPTHTSPQEIWAFVGAGARLPGGPTTQTSGGRFHLPLWLRARARATDRSCTPQAPAPLQAWPAAPATHRGSRGKSLLLSQALQRVLTPFPSGRVDSGGHPLPDTCSQMYVLTL